MLNVVRFVMTRHFARAAAMARAAVVRACRMVRGLGPEVDVRDQLADLEAAMLVLLLLLLLLFLLFLLLQRVPFLLVMAA